MPVLGGLTLTQMRSFNWIICVGVLVTSVSGATVDPPARIKLQKLDRSELSGMIISYTENDFEFMDGQKQTSTVKWEELPPDTIMNLHDRLVRKGSADQWFALGKKLLTMPGGRAPAERAFGKAVRADPKFKDQVAAARKEAKPVPATTPPPPTSANGSLTPPAEEPRAGSIEPRDPAKPVIGPQEVGAIDPSKWGKQSPEEMAAAVTKLKAFGERTRQVVTPALVPYETEFFLVYSDVPQAEAKKWLFELDRMYGHLANLFGVKRSENVWHGKALVFIFSKVDDYQKFEMDMHDGTMAAGSAGMCHTYGSGDVHIAFYRQPNITDFAHVLVHETTHGFLHRYRTAVHVPSWANEGLAEVIATELVPNKGKEQTTFADARQDLMTRKTLGKFFEADHIVAWQYPVARTLCEFMIRQNKQGYVEFINGIKGGLAWDEALKEKYGVTVEQLVNSYGISMSVANLKMD
jgi:hypothetical protein